MMIKYSDYSLFKFEDKIQDLKKSLVELKSAQKKFEKCLTKYPDWQLNCELIGNLFKKPVLNCYINLIGEDCQFVFTYDLEADKLKIKSFHCFTSKVGLILRKEEPKEFRGFINYCDTYKEKDIDFKFIEKFINLIPKINSETPSIEEAKKLLERIR